MLEPTMSYSHGNYHALVSAGAPKRKKPKKVLIVGGGLAGLAAAAFLIRDAKVPADRITIFVDPMELLPKGNPKVGWIADGHQLMDEHYETLWDLYSTIPTVDGKSSVLDEVENLNRENPNSSKRRLTANQSKKMPKSAKFGLSDRALRDLANIVLAMPEDLYDRPIKKRMSSAFLKSKFWLHLQTYFGFDESHSALELKLHLQRFVHLIPQLAALSGWKTLRFDQRESLIEPLRAWLEGQGVNFVHAPVTDVEFQVDPLEETRTARAVTYTQNGEEHTIPLKKRDLLFVTLGSADENMSVGSNRAAATVNKKISNKGAWALWRKIAVQDPTFGHPDNFCTRIGSSGAYSATLTVKDPKVRKQIERVAGRKIRRHQTVTGGPVTAVDSNWLLSWTVPRQPHFEAQPADQIVVWLDTRNANKPGNFIKKSMSRATGEEVSQEWLYHLGMPTHEIPELARTAVVTRPVAQPFVASAYLPRHGGDRPAVIPQGSTNFAFIGQFAETARDAVLTPEYSTRTAMEAVYGLMGVTRAVPETYNSAYDIRQIMRAATALSGGKPYSLPKRLLRRLSRTHVGLMLAQYGVVEAPDGLPDLQEAVRADN